MSGTTIETAPAPVIALEKLSRTAQAHEWMRQDPTRSAYAAAKKFGITQWAVGKNMPADLKTARCVICPHCGWLVPRR